METVAVSDPFLVGLIAATTLTALVMPDDCEAEFAWFHAPGAIRISNTVLAVQPAELDITVAQQLRFRNGALVELAADGLAQCQRIETALLGWPLVIRRETFAPGHAPTLMPV